ncbi:MFS transporter [Flexivirga caeni]|uniref:MFS transporter n=1 Tax=Flexivirga caeni TaxID=2294115 RepID=A0A3M9MHB0_9MICO|nr:MFS transporter [Flexivirga caeni]
MTLPPFPGRERYFRTGGVRSCAAWSAEVPTVQDPADRPVPIRPHPVLARRAALRFVLLIGVVSAFSDMTHEGARSITGPFLGSLGASGLVVSVVAGGGELLGYGLRWFAGRAADRTGRYWAIAFFGYTLQMAVVPLLAVSGNWPVAAALIVTERVGRAIRIPTRDAMTAHAAHRLGGGWAFGVREALDAGGAMVGPLVVSLVLWLHGSDRSAFAWLGIPAALTLLSLVFTWRQFPNPADLEAEAPAQLTDSAPRPPAFWLYLAAMGLIAVGYADWPLIALHFSEERMVGSTVAPVLYAVAMAAEAVAALVLGKVFDRVGLRSVLVVTVLTAAYAPLVFLGGLPLAVIGILAWGLGMAAQESIIKAVLTTIVPADRRATAFGLFDTGFGVAWFVGSILLGVLYDTSLVALAVVSALVQLAALPLLVLTRRRLSTTASKG